MNTDGLAWVNNTLSSNFGRIFTARPMAQGEIAAKLVW